MSRTQLIEQLTPVSRAELTENAFLFRRGDPVQRLHVVTEGACQLERVTLEGHTLPLARLTAPAIVAEGSLFNERYGCDCRALQHTHVESYSRDAVLALLQREPGLALSWLQRLSHQVMELRTRLELRNVKSARDRIALFLELNADATGNCPLLGTYKQLAQELGLSHEALYRTLGAMEQEGVIRRDGKMIRIIRSGS